MRKATREQITQSILEALQHAPTGLQISEIACHLDPAITRRTLQRYLHALNEAGQIVTQGTKRSTRYLSCEHQITLPLSPAAERIKQHIQQPLSARKIVGYHPNFLRQYQPNTTFYLSEKERQRLKQIGQQSDHPTAPGTYVKRILHRILIDLSWNSSRLEGNTYSLLETKRLIAFGASAEDKAAFETQMILNHKDAITFMITHLEDLGISKHMVLNIHALLSNNLLANPEARGQLRRIPVGVGRTSYQPPEIPQLITECFDHILTTMNHIDDPFEQCFFALVQLPYLQAFEDVNKRVSRLTANMPLIQHNMSPIAFIDVPQKDYINGLLGVYELNKTELLRDLFIWAYERSAQQYQVIRNTLGEPDTFRMQYRDELKNIINEIIHNAWHGNAMLQHIQSWAQQNVTLADQTRFEMTAEDEIASLHDGNISVYEIHPSHFEKWQSQRKNHDHA